MNFKTLVLSISITALGFASTIGIVDQAKAHTNYCGHGTRVYSGTIPLKRTRFVSHRNHRRYHIHKYAHEVYNFSKNKWQLVHYYDKGC
jgi:hypothetical protein